MVEKVNFVADFKGCFTSLTQKRFQESWENTNNLVDTGRKLNVHKTFRRRPGRLLNVLCKFNLRPVSTGKSSLQKINICNLSSNADLASQENKKRSSAKVLVEKFNMENNEWSISTEVISEIEDKASAEGSFRIAYKAKSDDESFGGNAWVVN